MLYINCFRVDGKTILDYMSKRHSLNEDDVAQVVRQMVTILSQMHANNLVHLDIRVSLVII